LLSELEELGNSGNLATASLLYEKASSEFAEIRAFLESYLQNGERAVKEETFARA
jgi:hypothetical protein